MAVDRVSEVLLKYTVDGSSLQRISTANEQVIRLLDKTAKQTLSVEQAAERVNMSLANIARAKAIDQIAVNFHEAERAGIATDEALAQVAETLSLIGASDSEIEQVTRQLVEAADAAERLHDNPLPPVPETPEPSSSSTSSSINFRQLGGFGSQILGATGAGGGQAASLIGNVTAAVTEFNPVMLAATGLFSVGTLALSEYNRQLEQNIENAKLYGDALAQAFLAGTTAQIQAQLAEQQARLEAAQQTRDLLRQEQTTSRAALAQQLDNASSSVTNWLNDAATNIFGTVPTPDISSDNARTIEGYNAAIERQDAIIQDAQTQIDGFNAVLGTNTIAQNDAEAAESARIDALISGTQDAAAAQIRASQLMQTGTSEQVQSAITANRAQMNIYDQARAALVPYAAANENAAAEVERYTGLINQLSDENVRLTNTVLPVIAAREQEIEVTQRLTEDKQKELAVQLAAAEAADAAQKRTNDAYQKYFDAMKATADAQAALAAAQQKEAEITATHETKRTEILADQRAKEDEIRAQTMEAGLKQVEEFERQRLEIERRANATLANARASRDVLAAILAQRQREEDLRKLKESDTKQHAELERAEQKQLDAARAAAVRSLQLEDNRYKAELATQQRATLQKLVDLQNAQNSERALRNAYHNAWLNQQGSAQQASLQGWVAYGNTLIGLAQRVAAAVSGYSGGSSGAGVPSFPPLNVLSPTPYSSTVNNSRVTTINYNTTIDTANNTAVRNLTRAITQY